jgi:hypothetical protein
MILSAAIIEDGMCSMMLSQTYYHYLLRR